MSYNGIMLQNLGEYWRGKKCIQQILVLKYLIKSPIEIEG